MITLRRTLCCGLIVLGLSFWGWSARHHWLPGIARWLDIGEVPGHVDYVLSLPGDEDYRPFQAAAMINLGLADRALLVKTQPSPEVLDGLALPTEKLLASIYRYCRVADDKLVVLPGESDSTAGDIGVLAQFMETSPQATVAVVTSHYHTRRSRWTLQRLLGKKSSRLTIVSAPNGEFEADDWWRTESGFLSITSEYIKLAAYLVLYGTIAWWIAGIAVAFLAWKVVRRIRAVRTA